MPDDLQRTFPHPKSNKSGDPSTPHYLHKHDHFLIIRSLGGVEKVLGSAATELLEQWAPDLPNAIGVIVDANSTRISDRVESYRNRFQQLFDHAQEVEAGAIGEGDPRLGLWVAPDNKKPGGMDDLLVQAARHSREDLVSRGEDFVTSLAEIEPEPCTKHRNKAVLGSIHQAVRPGASLASGLRKSKAWFETGMADVPPFKDLLAFITALTGV
ncbi:MAG: hypothetical protein GY842_12515 [bacterium]|nr:hypothetical protein [bacterium]